MNEDHEAEPDNAADQRAQWHPDAVQASHPNVPRRGPVYLAFTAVVAAGMLGALIGYGLVAASCSERPPRLQQLLEGAVRGYHAHGRSCTVPLAGGTVFGAALAAIGAGVVAVLMLRAMGDWRTRGRRFDESGAE